MRRAVVRVNPGPDRSLSATEIAAGIERLRAEGIAVRPRDAGSELILTIDSPDAETARATARSTCEQAFGAKPYVGVVTFASRGTDEDALGVLERFGVPGSVERFEENGEEVAVFTFSAADRKHVPESRLHTALEAALNCEIRIEYA